MERPAVGLSTVSVRSAVGAARGINRGYVDGKMTAYLNWPVVAAVTPNLPYPTMGVALASQPWSGSYSIGKNAWVMAQTTQFTAPGWKYLDSSSGYIGGNRSNGSYVSLKSANNSDYSTVVEFSLTAQPGYVYTLWTSASAGEVRVYGGDCLDASGQGTSPGTKVDIWTCAGGADQKWTLNANGTITGLQSGLCLDATSAGTGNGTVLELRTCTGSSNQKWTRG